MRNGDGAVHIVSDLVTKLKNKARDIEEQKSGEEANVADDIHYGEADEELAIFDQLTNREDACATNLVDCSDKEWFTNQLSAAYGDRDPEIFYEASQEFGEGGGF